MKITIRPAEEADRATIIEASEATWHAHRARQPHAFAENGWDMVMAREHVIAFRDAKGMPVGTSENLFVADADGRIVGFILLSWHLRGDAPDYPKGAVSDLWVDDDWRGKGIAAQLVDFAKKQADAAGWHDLTAQVWEGAPSAGLFEKAGFQPRSTIWRHGPDAPAPPIEMQEAPARDQADNWWKWAVILVILGCSATIILAN